ncbi:MAG: Grx4 family monothiol glutaredoxin [Bdellovibrionales bacterium]|nr:Grx4 family monothiol glutaredoxin [Bdellovibrionales bacterium]
MTDPVKNKIESLLSENSIVLFMKGDAEFPQCGFSARAVSILNEVGARYKTVNVLEDQEIREGIKEYGNWPTIPQLYINKELIGGSDIMLDMYNSGELKQMIPGL